MSDIFSPVLVRILRSQFLRQVLPLLAVVLILHGLNRSQAVAQVVVSGQSAAGGGSAEEAAEQGIVDQWRVSFRRPPAGWRTIDFDDSDWQEAYGGFGTHGTPGSRIGTVWGTNAIWLRKRIKLDRSFEEPALLIHHDEDAEVFLNGKLLAKFQGFVSEYQVVPIASELVSTIQKGENLLAVHCKQTNGGQFIDVHLVDAKAVPALPKPKRSKKPFASELITKWGADLDPANVWSEYPRPQMVRSTWSNLNGHWDYAVTPSEQEEKPSEWNGQILVPFSLESKLGGVELLLDSTEALWYHRSFDLKEKPTGKLLLHFEAVDYRCEVFVNGISVGTHQGGNTPFHFAIEEFVREGVNELIVRVEDETEGWQLRGKQTLNARGIWYTQVSGIWQTVWLEETPSVAIRQLKIHTDASEGAIDVMVLSNANHSDGWQTRLRVLDGEQVIATATGNVDRLQVKMGGAKLWSPDSPFLYGLEVALINPAGEVVDCVESYAGIRTIGKVKDESGHWRFTLNGDPLFHWGPLDQGWWPDGLLTPPSDEAMRFDVDWLKAAGFNMIRKHIKIEPRRFYAYCDQIGMLVWQDHVSGGANPPWTRLQPDPVDAAWPDEQHEQFMLELERMIDSLENHPSIAVWVPFNEAWGQHRTVEVGNWVSKRDPSRLVNVASGGNFWPSGDIVDSHRYPDPGFPFEQGANGRFEDYIKVMGEFGGHGYPVQGHLWDANRRNWGYGGLPQTEAEYKQRYVKSLQILNELRGQGIAAGVYTQTTDVEGEINGLMTYDRKVIKIPADELAGLHRSLFDEATLTDGQVSDRQPAPPMDRVSIESGLKSHDRALHIKSGWIRDPYVILGPDDHYYLTGTQPNPDDPREVIDPYNIGLGDESIVGEHVRVWRSKDLIQWESLGEPFGVDDSIAFRNRKGKQPPKRLIWAPELHWMGDRWALVHCPALHSSFALTSGHEVAGPWEQPLFPESSRKHDPSLFQDDDGTWYMLWQNTMVAPLSSDLKKFTRDPVRIDPTGERLGPEGKPISRIGHEGATIRKIGGKYVHFGTAWSTDQGRKGSYNLYYCLADEITGPYGPRRFVGRFLGHGTPFQDRAGKWWCTAFFNANVPPLSREGIQGMDLSDDAQTINEQGVTIVPLEVRVESDGDVYIRAKDPDYANPGPDESQRFQ